jgi:hypothetical protein
MTVPSVSAEAGGGLVKAYLEFETEPKRFECLFNPDSISITRSNNWSGGDPWGYAEGNESAGGGVNETTYAGAINATMSLQLIFDTTDTGQPVTDFTSKLWSRMEIDKNLPGTNKKDNNGRPPKVRFGWGQYLTSFQCVVESITINFTYFSSKGTPLRAEVSLQLKQAEAGDFGKQNPTSGTPYPHQVHRVQPGETLDRISARYYGDATKWRALAAANAVEDPLTIRPGSLLGIPPLEAM